MMKYGPEHRQAKKDRLDKLDVKACEITGGKGFLECHHNDPKAFNGPDMEANSVILVDHFHQYLHRITHVSAPEQFERRKAATKAIQNRPLSFEVAKHHNTLKDIDAEIMPLWVTNLLTKFHGDLQSTLTITTVVRNMETIRDLTIENVKLRARIEFLESRGQDRHI